MKDLKDNDLIAISGGSWYAGAMGGGVGSVPLAFKTKNIVKKGDRNRRKMKTRRAKWNSRGGNYRW